MNSLTERKHWDDAWAQPPRWRLPSRLIVDTLNIQRLLRRYVTPGSRFIELGCAPGKMLAWVASELHADVSGLDYSAPGVEWARELFTRLELNGDLRCEDAFATTFTQGSFDIAFSAGLIEHFDDPRTIVRAHLNLVKPGGKAVITIPNYGGLYGTLQRKLDPQNLALHNVSIMKLDALRKLAPEDLTESVRTFAGGRMSPWLLNFHRRLPASIARALSLGLNAAGILQPIEISAVSPFLVLEIEKKR
jgi:2-polyprenyl-3-methyl-5-hydroxy-6-metoxy-1,4-benzoquinol methylase